MLAIAIAALVVAALAIAALHLTTQQVLRSRPDERDAWREIHALQQAEIGELRNRLGAHSWEQFHNLQAHTPGPLDRAYDVLNRIQHDHEPDDEQDTQAQLEERLRQAMSDSGLDIEGEGAEAWRPVVG